MSKQQELGLWDIIKPVNREIYTGMVVSALSAVFWFVSLLLFLPISQELIADSTRTGRVWALVGISLAAVVAAFIARIMSFRISHLGAFRLEQLLRTELSQHLASVPLGYVLSAGSGTLKKVVLDDVRNLHIFVADSTPLFARAAATPVLCLVLMFILDWRMALISLALFPIAIIAMRFAFKDYEVARKKLDDANEHISSVIIEYVQGMQVVRTFDDGSSSFKRYREALNDSTAMVKEWSGKTQTAAYIARTLLASLPTLAVVLAAGISFYQAGTLHLPVLLMFILLAPTVSESIVPLVWLQQLITNASASVKRIGALRAVKVLPEVASEAAGKTPHDASVTLENVSFRYQNRDDNALTDVSIAMPAGTVTALVGPSGAGKSTIAQLILRFWDVSAGRVLVGGVDVREMTSDTLMKQVSFVFQSPFLLHDSIRENIRLGKPDATDAEIEAAAKAAQAHDFIMNELPDGYDTKVGERGSSLSGGQRQRITIARAILQDSPIIVLDEATAFADPDNEAKIHQALAQLAAGKTLIVIAHRLSTIKDAHQIVVMDAGRVSEVGTHVQLLEAKGLYAKLWSNFETAQGWGLRTPSHTNTQAEHMSTERLEA